MLAEINGCAVADRRPLSAYTELKDDGSTASGCWIYCGAYADGVNQTARRKPGRRAESGRSRMGLGLAEQPAPAVQPRLRRSARAGRGASARSTSGGTPKPAGGPATTSPTSKPTKPPDYVPPEDARAQDAISGTDPFIMQADGRGWLYAPSGLVDGPLPTHYEPQESPIDNPMYSRAVEPDARAACAPRQPLQSQRK